MQDSTSQIEGLTAAGCTTRQQRLASLLRGGQMEAALICDRRHVYYLSGYWSAFYHAPLLIIRDDGAAHAVLPEGASSTGVVTDSISYYEASRLGTLVDDQFGAALRVIDAELTNTDSWGIDQPGLVPSSCLGMRDITPAMLALRRAKDEDEAMLIGHAIRACEAAYARAAQILRPGLREVDVYAEMHAAAVKEVGEPIGELGNDFQSGTPGGAPRTRAVEQGELMPLDIAVTVRGYRCDLCRTFAIGRDPSATQLEAARLVGEALEWIESQIHVSGSCRRLYEDVARMLDGKNGWRFFHHLGHGTGLSPHEAPRLNPHWDDSFAIGDLFTVEPGLYHKELRGGVRLEQNYWLTADGLRRLSSYPLAL
jgi:Xaa-Pro aminopeptidase